MDADRVAPPWIISRMPDAGERKKMATYFDTLTDGRDRSRGVVGGIGTGHRPAFALSHPSNGGKLLGLTSALRRELIVGCK